MILSKKTLEKLRELINEETEYRSGPRLVEFFNQLGFHEQYGQGFPSRWMFTDGCLEAINGTPELDQCIRNLFAPVNFIGEFQKLDGHIADFNQYLTFDKWQVRRHEADIGFKKLEKVEIDESIEGKAESESEFLSREFNDIEVARLGLESTVSDVIRTRVSEIEKCFSAGSPLAVILLAGSTLEGVFLGLATKYPKQFNSTKAAPKDSTGKVRPLHDWTLSSFIDVARELRLIEDDTRKFSHSLRDFRNYIHPFEQLSSGFSPRERTAKICLQVLKSAIADVSENLKSVDT